MKMARRLRLLYALALLLAAAAYSAVLFSLKRTMMAAHWVAYGFTLLAFLWLFVETCIPEGKYKRYPMFGMAVSKLSGVYFAVQFALGGCAGDVPAQPARARGAHPGVSAPAHRRSGGAGGAAGEECRRGAG